jgi:hypothetical protein
MPPINPICRSSAPSARRFSGSTSQVLLFYYEPPGCLRILDPLHDAEMYRLPDRLLQCMPLSNPRALIQDHNPGRPAHRNFWRRAKAPLVLLLSEGRAGPPERRLGGHHPAGKAVAPRRASSRDPVEYLPFIEGYARAGRFDDAFELRVPPLQQAPCPAPRCARSGGAPSRPTAPDAARQRRDSRRAAVRRPSVEEPHGKTRYLLHRHPGI